MSGATSSGTGSSRRFPRTGRVVPANRAAAREGNGQPQRLTLRYEDLRDVRPALYQAGLDAVTGRVRTGRIRE